MCVLRVTGAGFDAQEFLRTSALRPCNVFRAGEPRIPSRPHGRVWTKSGFTVAVSEAALSDLAGQVADACRFLERHAGELGMLSKTAAVEDMRLDFGIALRIGRNDVIAQYDYFPPELVQAAGNLGIGIELSTYACSDEDEGNHGNECA